MKRKNQVKLLTLLSLTLGVTINVAAAAGYAAVNKDSCNRMQNNRHPFILVLHSGDDLIKSITQCAAAAKLLAASVSGLGQVHNPTLAYFTSNPQDKPTLTKFDGFYELASLNGNITNNRDHYYTHIHVALADKTFRGITGHLNSTEVGLTVEVSIIPLSAPVERNVDAKTGFGLIATK